MTTKTEPIHPELLASALDLIARATTLARNYEEDLQEIVREAADAAITDEQKRSLFMRIVTALHNGGIEADSESRARIAAAVRTEVDALLTPSAEQGQSNTSTEKVEFVSRNGHSPQPVKPAPIFKGRQVPMREGFVDVTTISLWKGNHRVELWVQEFRDREGREPDDHEMLGILHGEMVSAGQKDDPFGIVPLAKSIAERGVALPPILTQDGQLWDGNRRIAAAKYVLTEKGFTEVERERARWVKVWVADETTQDVIDDVVVAMNFDPDCKQAWDEYVKARLVVERFRYALERHTAAGNRITSDLQKRLKKEVAEHYAIEVGRVTRYLEMVKWSDDFEAYHVEERGLDKNQVRYKANDIFQYFFEIQAGRGDAVKLTTKVDQDDDLKAIVYDLMYDVIDSGAHVRALHKVVADEPSLQLLIRAHTESQKDDFESAKSLILEAISESAKNSPTKKTGFAQFAKSMVDRLGSATPKQWETVDTEILRELRKVLPSSLGGIDGVLSDRGIIIPPAPARE
jgi:hypothetical protein